MSKLPLTNEQLCQLTHTLFAVEPHGGDTSHKYKFISTIEIIEELRAYQWYPMSVLQANVRDETKAFL